MDNWFDVGSFLLGLFVGSGLTGIGIGLRIWIRSNHSGDSEKYNQKNIKAGKDFVGRDKKTEVDQ